MTLTWTKAVSHLRAGKVGFPGKGKPTKSAGPLTPVQSILLDSLLNSQVGNKGSGPRQRSGQVSLFKASLRPKLQIPMDLKLQLMTQGSKEGLLAQGREARGSGYWSTAKTNSLSPWP